MPISILFNKFSDYYAKLKAQEDTNTKVQQGLNLKKRLQRRLESCCEPAAEDSDEDSRLHIGLVSSLNVLVIPTASLPLNSELRFPACLEFNRI